MEDERIQFGRRITEEGFYNGTPSVIQRIRIDIKTDRNTYMKDIISCAADLYKSEGDLDIHVEKDKFGNPKLIQKTYTVLKQTRKHSTET